ncbi:MAG: hypothetical protein AAGC88_00210 [Bacteroidota bacterium]
MMRWVFLLVVSLLFVKCTEIPDCQDTRSPIAQVRFYAAADSSLLFVDFDSVFIDGSTTKLYEDTLLSQLNLRLNPMMDQSIYTFYADSTVHTLEISHESRIAIENPDCGPIQYFFALEPIASSFDSVALISSTADFRVDINVEVYR